MIAKAVEELVFEHEHEATEVLTALNERIKTYGSVTVSELYDLIGITGTYSDSRWGWLNLKDATVRPFRGGSKLSLPEPSIEVLYKN